MFIIYDWFTTIKCVRWKLVISLFKKFAELNKID